MTGGAKHQAGGKWPQILSQWEAVYRDLQNQDSKATVGERADLYRKFWGASSDLLLYWVRTHEQLNISLEPKPILLFAYLGRHAEDLAKGNVSELFTLVGSGSGRRKSWVAEDRDKDAGIIYILAAEGGRIVDNHPVQTVSMEYGVTRQAVQRWLKDREAIQRKYLVDALSVEHIVNDMKTRAARYKQLGRSSEAIRNRDAKRSRK